MSELGGERHECELDEFRELVKQAAFLEAEIDKLAERRQAIRERIQRFVEQYGKVSHKGHRVVRLDEPVRVGNKTRKGYRCQTSIRVTLDTEAAYALVREKGLADRVIKIREDLDQDELMACFWEGLITEEELNRILIRTESVSLVPF